MSISKVKLSRSEKLEVLEDIHEGIEFWTAAIERLRESNPNNYPLLNIVNGRAIKVYERIISILQIRFDRISKI